MKRAEQAERAERFRGRHRGRTLFLPNAWDALSARVLAAASFEAVATTSGGLSWALGYPDGEKAPWEEVVAQTRRIVRVAGVPVTADIEAGFAESREDLKKNVAGIIGTGVAGINLEDGTGAGLRPVAEAADRIRAAREAARAAGVPIVINARTDLYLHPAGEAEARFEETLARGRAYLAAGADCVYPIGLSDGAIIGRLVKALAAPVNIMVRAGVPSLAELEALGVARVSTASALALAAMARIREIADEWRTTGRFDTFAPAITHAEAQRLFAALPAADRK